MQKITFTKKGKIQAIVVGGLTVLAILYGISQKTGLGQAYQSISVNGTFVGYTASRINIEDVIHDVRREMAADSSERLCMDYEWETESVRKPFVTLLTEDELKGILKETLQGTVIRNKERVYTVAVEGYRANFRSLLDVQTFLNKVKAPADEANVYVPEISFKDSHINGILQAKLVSGASAEAAGEAEAESGEDESGQTKEAGEAVWADGAKAGINAELLSAMAAAMASEQTENTSGEERDTGYKVGILDMEFVESVEVYENYVNADEVSDIDEEVIEVTKEKESNKIYVVESGDCLSVIAMDYDTTVASIVALNGLKNADAIRDGQELIIAVPEPDLKLRITLGEIYEEEYTKEPKIIENDTWYTTKEVVLQEGSAGYRERNDVVVYENGIEVSRELHRETIMVESQEAVIERGTIIPPTYIKPLSGGRYTSGYGYRWGRLHKGVDWACPVGTTVYASCAGRVIQASYNGGYGNNVVISHADGRLTRYAHNSKLLVSVGQTVEQGEAIALSGNTGRSTGPHVHFEIYINGAAVNPLKYISN